MNEIVQHSGSALAIRPEQADWTPEQGQALLDMFNLGQAPHSVIRSYFHVCQTTGLDPFKRQVHLIERSGKWTPQTSIDGFRIIRDRSKVYDGDETFWVGSDGVWTDAWLRDEPPVACKFVLYVKGRSHPVTAVARWNEYVQLKRDGQPTQMWQRMSAHMLAKVAEALAIRKAFPDDTGGLYTDDEMMQADVHDEQHASTSSRRQRSPGLLDMEAAAPVGAPGVGGGFMDVPQAAPAEVIEDAVVVEEHEPAAEPAAEPATPMDMAPEAPAVPEWTWVAALAEFCERPQPQLHELRAMYDAASVAGALGDRVHWIGDPRAGGMSLGDAIMAVKSNLEQGLAALENLA